MILTLTNGLAVRISPEDADLTRWSWHMGGYPMRQQSRKTIYLHRVIAKRMGIPESSETDHRDRDRLNCTRDNIRAATRGQNERNKRGAGASGLRGVSWDKINGLWTAEVWLDKKRVWRKAFATAREAAIARDKIAKKYHGDFVCLNFPEEV